MKRISFKIVNSFFSQPFIRKLLFVTLRFLLSKRRNNIGGITCAGRNDGGGAQIHGVISTQLFAHDFNIKYIHTPFSAIEHKPKEWTKQRWINAWESYFNLGSAYLGINSAKVEQYVFVHSAMKALMLLTYSRDPQLIVVVHDCHDYADLWPEKYLPFLKEVGLIKNYPKNNNNTNNSIGTNGHRSLTVAVHLRRGDVSLSENKTRYTSNKEIRILLSFIQEKYPQIYLDVTIYSNSSDGDSLQRDFPECRVDCKSDPFDVLTNLRSADILVMAKSSLSYVAALLCSGEVIYTPFCHAPLLTWQIVLLNNDFRGNFRRNKNIISGLVNLGAPSNEL